MSDDTMNVIDAADVYPDTFWQVGYADAGWNEIVRKALDELASLCTLAPAVITILQIKEKFGGLRLYYTINTDLCDEDTASTIRKLAETIVSLAERRCWETCGACTASGYRDEVKTQGKGWLKTRCKVCRDE